MHKIPWTAKVSNLHIYESTSLHSEQKTPRLFDKNWEDIQHLIEERHKTHRALTNNPKSVVKKEAFFKIC